MSGDLTLVGTLTMFDALHMDFGLQLPVSRWWGQLCERNLRSRLVDEGVDAVPPVRVRVVCPHCGAPIFFLAYVEEDGGARICRACAQRFSVDA